MKNQNEEISFKEIAAVFIPKIWLILLVGILCAALVFVYLSYVKVDTYTSSFDIYVYKYDSSATTGDIQAAEDMLETYEYFLNTDTFLDLVILNLPDEYSSTIKTTNIKSMMSVSPVGTSGALRVGLTSSTRDLVYAIAGVFVDIAPNSIVQYIPNALMVSVTEIPKLPEQPNSKNIARNSVIAFLASAAFSMLCIWMINLFDTIIHDKKKIENNFDIPVLGIIPKQDISSK